MGVGDLGSAAPMIRGAFSDEAIRSRPGVVAAASAKGRGGGAGASGVPGNGPWVTSR